MDSIQFTEKRLRLREGELPLLGMQSVQSPQDPRPKVPKLFLFSVEPDSIPHRISSHMDIYPAVIACYSSGKIK